MSVPAQRCSRPCAFAEILWLSCVAGISLLSIPAQAADLALIGGQGDEVTVGAAAIRMRDWKAWTPGGRWHYALAGEWQVGWWNAQQADANASSLVDGSLTAVLTMRPAEGAKSAHYLEFGFGLHLLSEHEIAEQSLGTRFQFGEFVGAGTHFGPRRQYALGARLQHVSNGRIAEPNDGVTFLQLVVRYSF